MSGAAAKLMSTAAQPGKTARMINTANSSSNRLQNRTMQIASKKIRIVVALKIHCARVVLIGR